MTYVFTYSTTGSFSTDDLIYNLALAAKKIKNIAFNSDGTAWLSLLVDGRMIDLEFSEDYLGSIDSNSSYFDRITFYDDLGEKNYISSD
ncbi:MULTISPECIES: hypothetical protein [unclassified Shinella]|uniref:hypothetical protein n=1 Tax=unclassified Shinella TaxID=2643062 RepID=UPI00225D22BE|nr:MULTISPECIES: hypothetical protein [unclassified Shinella]MCO5153667.1 hypothetical protein [Shinella sp.]MDC7259924.1 hypothetical protein [Shinella sp. YE25]CAI0341727.1 hypothetical protein SHINE37_80117 [Rhizobiaceae bacterium]CAK7262043.1 protein of unknown function [Shinella sp. WSC3-e]